jgi:hypothetical protein
MLGKVGGEIGPIGKLSLTLPVLERLDDLFEQTSPDRAFDSWCPASTLATSVEITETIGGEKPPEDIVNFVGKELGLPRWETPTGELTNLLGAWIVVKHDRTRERAGPGPECGDFDLYVRARLDLFKR